MNINTNVGLRDRSRVTLSGFKGLDTLSTSVDVSAIHATDMKNLISRDGVNHKRFGWKTYARITETGSKTVRGVFSFNLYGVEFLIAYAGKKFLLIDKENKDCVDITTVSLDSNGKPRLNNLHYYIQTSNPQVDTNKLEDVECKCYINENKAYFVGCGDFLVFSKWLVEDKECFEFRRVIGNEDVYIPTTTENISYEGMVEPPERITAEERNLLSPYTYNLLVGKDEVKEDETLVYYLDTKNFNDVEIEITNSEGETTLLKNGKVSDSVEYYNGDRLSGVGLELENAPISITNLEIKSYKPYWASGSDAEEDGFFQFSAITDPAQLDELHNRYVVEGASLRIKYSEFIDLATMANGDKLCIKLNQNGYGETKELNLENGKICFYKFPIITPKLVYLQNNNKVNEILELDKSSFTLNAFKGNEGKLVSTIHLTTNIQFDLIDYIAVLEKTTEDFTLKLMRIGTTITFDNCVIDRLSGKLTFNGIKDKDYAYKQFTPETPNIKVKIKKELQDTKIDKAIKSCEFGLEGAPDRLFVVDSTGNTVRWSKDNNFTYFGDKSFALCGTNDKKITGMDRLNDSTLLLVKEYSVREPSIYVLVGKFESGTNEAGTSKMTPKFIPHGYQVGMGAVGEIINFNGDCLMVAKDGVYSIALGENMTVDSRYVLHRSRQISNTLEKFDLSKSKCIAFNGKFYLAVGGTEKECFVADNKYTASFKGDMQNVVNYEWWRWTNIPVSAWGYVGNDLCFGTEDGQICMFTDKFYDESITSLSEFSLHLNGEEVTESHTIEIKENDIFNFKTDIYGYIKTSNFKVENNQTRFYLPLSSFVDKEIIIIDGQRFNITKEDTYFCIDYVDTSKEEIEIGINYKDKPLLLKKENDKFVLQDLNGNIITWRFNGVIKYTVEVHQKETIEAYWVSGAMDLGTRAYTKCLTCMILTGEKDLANRLKYGIKTLLTLKKFEYLRANNDLDFEKLDLETLSLDSCFASSYAKRLNIRNVNFIMLYFMSDIDEDMAINSVQIEFKLYKKNIGVR